MPMPEALARLVPPGTSPRKLATAGVLVVAALGVVTFNVLTWNDSGDAAALSLDADGDGYVDEPGAPQGATPADAPPVAEPQPFGEAPATTPAEPAPGSIDAAPAARGAEPDWSSLFEQVLERAEADSALAGSRPLAELHLTGLVSGADGGFALIDGRCLRPGDAVPGTRYAVAEILADRVLLSAPGRAEPLELVLEAPGGAR